MRAGQLRHRVTLEQLAAGDPDAFGQVPEVWESVADLYVSIEPQRLAEDVGESTGGRQLGQVTHTVRTRPQSGDKAPQPAMRLKLPGGRILHIVGVLNVAERGRELELLCQEVLTS